MRATFALWLCTAPVVLASDFPWPWKHKTTTPAPPSEISAFESGVAEAFSFNITACYKEPKTGIRDLWEAAEDYKRGGIMARAKALVLFGEGIHHITRALKPCEASMRNSSKFEDLMHDLKDPRYYTPHNALTLALNLAEDRKMLEESMAAWQKGDFKTAGYEMVNTALDVLLNPGIPDSKGKEATEIAQGLAEGLNITSDFPVKCFADLTVEIRAIAAGVIDLTIQKKVKQGLESLSFGLKGIVPTFKTCLADKKEIMDFLREVGDFKHPVQLAEKLLKNMEAHGIDISLQVASAVIASKGKEYRRFGHAVGDILEMLIHPASKEATLVV